MMSHSVSSMFAGVALTMFATACAGPTTQAGSAVLPGMWYGSFTHPGRLHVFFEVRHDAPGLR